MKLTLRLITILCYFLPFTFFLATCNGVDINIAYNKADADKDILLEKESSKGTIDSLQNEQQALIDTTNTNADSAEISESTTKTSSDTLPRSPNYGDIIFGKVIQPTDTSLSGVGSVLYFKNLTGQITIAISILISLILFVAFRFLRSRKAQLYLILTAFLCFTIFIIDCFISNVTLLWGSWTLLILLLFQLIIEFKDKPA